LLTHQLTSLHYGSFAQWILNLGDGELDNSEGETFIRISYDLTIQHETYHINDIVNAIYPELKTKYNDTNYLEDKAILAPRNEDVQEINDYMIDLINVDEEIYLNSDSICKAASNIQDQNILHLIKF
jgi:ATP-dependent DNA helicase PIF1